MKSVKKQSVMIAAGVVAAGLFANGAMAQVNGQLDAGEYGAALSRQTAPTGFGDNINELNELYARITSNGSLQWLVTGNLEQNGNRALTFLDAKPGGGIETTLPNGYGVFGSIGGAGIDDFGTDTDGGFGVNPTPGGGSIMFPNFNPEKGVDSNRFRGAADDRYYINLIDLTVPNQERSSTTGLLTNRDRYLGFGDVFPNTNDPAAEVTRTLTYTRLSDTADENGVQAELPAGFGQAAFDNSNTDGVFGRDFANPPGLLGFANEATKGMELLFDAQMVDNLPGTPIKMFIVLNNNGGDFLSNQVLGGNVAGGQGIGLPIDTTNLGNPGGDGGAPLLDMQLFPNLTYVEVPIATKTLFGASDYYDVSNWVQAPQNGINTTARVVSPASGGSDVQVNSNTTLGGLMLERQGGSGVTVNGTGVITLQTYGQRALISGSGFGEHTISNQLIVNNNLEIDVSADTVLNVTGPLTVNGLISLTKTNLGAAKIPAVVGVGALSVQGGELAANPDSGVLEVKSLEIATGAILNVTNNDLIVDYAETSVIADLIAAFVEGRLTANGDDLGLPTYLAIAEAADLGLETFSGQSVDGSAVLAKFTYVGDANLDGQVDALDYERVDLAIGNTGVLGTAQGDLNYDGNVDALDYEQIDLNIGNGVGSPLATVLIPEPASLSLLAMGGGLMVRRRRA